MDSTLQKTGPVANFLTMALSGAKIDVTLDKIGSVTKNLQLSHRVKISKDIPAVMGSVLAVEVCEDKSVYNTLELPNGRFSVLKKGDIIAVALGNRRALKGFVGHVPKSIRMGDTIHLLNQGGVAGECSSANTIEVGNPLRIKVLGAVVRDDKPVNVGDAVIFQPADQLESNIPLVIASGTSMDSGKTTVIAEVVRNLSRSGLQLAGAKLAGVALLRDTYKMADYGAKETVSFLDAGLTSTVVDKDLVVRVAKGAINHLSRNQPDVIVVEFGDGIFGMYGVMAIMEDEEIQKNVAIHIGCANDPVGALKLVEVCEEIGLPVDIISGAVTDNQVGREFIEENTNVTAFNAFSQSNQLLNHILNKWKN